MQSNVIINVIVFHPGISPFWFSLCKYLILLHFNNAVYVVTYELMVMEPITYGFMSVESALTLAAFIVVCPF